MSQSYSLLVDEPRLQAKQQQLAAKEFSAGVIAFYWAVSKCCEQLAHHNVFMSGRDTRVSQAAGGVAEPPCQFKWCSQVAVYLAQWHPQPAATDCCAQQHNPPALLLCFLLLAGDYTRSWERAREPAGFVKHPNFYLCCPSRTDPTAAPADGDSVMVLLPVANIQERAGDADYAALVTAGRRLILQTLAAAGVDLRQEHIVQEQVREPAEWREAYGLEHGAAFGLSHGLNQLALFRPGCVDPQASKGLYFVGASSRPGNGVPLVMLGARLATERILADAAGR